MTFETVVPVVPLHEPLKPATEEMTGDAGTVNADGKAIEIVSPDESAPLDDVENPTVHALVAPALPGLPVYVTEFTAEPVAEITTAADGTAPASSDVATVKPDAA